MSLIVLSFAVLRLIAIAGGKSISRTNRTHHTIDRFVARYRDGTINQDSNGWAEAAAADDEISALGTGLAKKRR